MADWGCLSLFEVAQITNAKNFLSHAAYQSYLTDIWMGEVHPSTPFFLVRISDPQVFNPPWIYKLKFATNFWKIINLTALHFSLQLVVCALIPPLPMFLKYNSKDGKKIADTTNDKNGPEKDDQLVEKNPNVLKRLQFFYTSPAVKFILNGITYLIFLGKYVRSSEDQTKTNKSFQFVRLKNVFLCPKSPI